MEPLDELFCLGDISTVDTTKAAKYFKDLEREVSGAERHLKWSEDKDAIEAVSTIASELSWFSDQFYALMAAYEEAQERLDYYKREAESRLDEEEKYALNVILIRNRLEDANGKVG